MPTRKIAEPNNERRSAWSQKVSRCRDPEHLPPSMQVFTPGTYEHECPSCQHITVFVVRQQTMGIVPYIPRLRHNEVICGDEKTRAVTVYGHDRHFGYCG